jgi:hypothetical protein
MMTGADRPGSPLESVLRALVEHKENMHRIDTAYAQRGLTAEAAFVH